MKERPFNQRAHPAVIAQGSKWVWPAIGRPGCFTKARAVADKSPSTSTLDNKNKPPYENQTRTAPNSDCIGFRGNCSRWPSDVRKAAKRRSDGASEIRVRQLFENRICAGERFNRRRSFGCVSNWQCGTRRFDEDALARSGCAGWCLGQRERLG